MEDFKRKYSELIERLKQEEGYSQTAFPDNDQYSIGYGTKANSKYEQLPDGDKGKEIAEQRLIDYLKNSINYYNNLFPTKRFNKVREDAILDMLYNLGPTKIRSFKNMMRAINSPVIDWIHVAYHAYDSKWFWQVGHRSKRIVKELAKGI